MATWLKSANFNGTNGTHFYISLSYDILSTDVANNKHTVRYYLNVGSQDGYSGGGAYSNGYIGGTWVGGFTSIGRNTSFQVGYRDIDHYHNADGTGTASYSASVNTPWDIGSASLSGSFTLPVIPRASKPSIITYPTTTTDIGNIGDTVKIHMNRKSSSFTHTVTYSFDPDGTGTPATGTIGTAKGVVDNVDWTIPTSFYAKMTKSESGSGTVTVTTYNGNTQIGSPQSVGFTVHVDKNTNSPTFTTIEFNEASQSEGGLGTVVGSASNNVKVVKGYSSIKVTITSGNKAVAKNSATINRYEAKCGTKSVTANYSASATVTMIIPDVDGDTLEVSAIDSRELSTKIVKNSTSNFNVVSYTPIKKTSTNLQRDNNVSVSTRIAFTGTYTGTVGTVTNALKIKRYKYRKSGTSTWTTGTTTLSPSVSGNNITLNSTAIVGDVTGGFNQNNSYEVMLQFADKIGNIKGENYYYSEILTLGSGSPAKAVFGNCIALGLPYDESEGGRIQINKDIKVYDGTNWISLFVDD